MTKKLSPYEERAVAYKACVDPRTVRRYLEGAPLRSTTAARIAEVFREMEALGLEAPALASGIRVGEVPR